jgi:hypothetical protein
MTSAWHQSYRLMIILTIVVGLFMGCSSVFQDLDDRMNRMRFKPDYASYENALTVYRTGDYERAMDLFRTLSAAKTNPKLARKAWLGEICSRLMLADTQSAYATAISLWHDFGKSADENDDALDLVLLDPLIVRLTPKSTIRVIEIHSPATQIPVGIEAPSGQLMEDLPQEDQPFQNDAAPLKKKAARLQRQIDAVLAENRSLKQKIKALEAIDQSMQKKKTEMAAPSE